MVGHWSMVYLGRHVLYVCKFYTNVESISGRVFIFGNKKTRDSMKNLLSKSDQIILGQSNINCFGVFEPKNPHMETLDSYKTKNEPCL